jgi:hypothetical protein
VEKPVEVSAGDVIGLGSYSTVLDTGSWRQSEPALVDRDRGGVSTETSRPTFEFVPEESTVPETGALKVEIDSAGVLSHPGRLVALLLQAPLIALLIVGLLGPKSPAPILFWLGLAATWFGLSAAVLGNVIDGTALRSGLTPAGAPALVTRLLVLVSLCVLQCLLAWAVVANMAALKAAGAPALGLLILASAVGLALGFLILVLAPRPAVAWAILPAVLLLAWLFGGGWPPLSRLPVVSSLIPTHWAFEGLLLLESDEHHMPANADASEPTVNHDLAEAYFPAETERMGVKADAMALGAMLLGLAASVAFISTASEPRR